MFFSALQQRQDVDTQKNHLNIWQLQWIRYTINVQSCFVFNTRKGVRSYACVEATILGSRRRYVKVTDDISRLVNILTNGVSASEDD